MMELVTRLGWSIDDVEFMRDTFAMLLLARRYYLEPANPQLQSEILDAKAIYKQRWPRSQRQRYRLRTSFDHLNVNALTLRWLFALLVRRKRGYRAVLDHFFTLRVLSWVWRLLRSRNEKALPKLARKTAMGVDALFR
jgi:hypothetical protein